MLGNKPPYTTMQQLNLDWILSKLKTLLRLVPDDGAVGQILRRTRDGAVWSDEQGGGGGGAVESVNGKTGAVVLDASDVGALPDDYTPPVTSVNGETGAIVLGKSDVGLANLDNVRQYSATNPPPYPVTSVNGQTGAVVISTGGAVDSVNGQTGTVVLDAADVCALSDDYRPSFGTRRAITLPFTTTESGFFEGRLRANSAGRLYANFIGSDFTAIIDGYQSQGAYISQLFPITAGITIPTPTTNNVMSSDYFWTPLI